MSTDTLPRMQPTLLRTDAAAPDGAAPAPFDMSAADSALSVIAEAPTSRPGRPARASRWRGDSAIYATLVLLVAVAWLNSRLGIVRIDHDANYWVAVAGGSMMALLFVYPLRKYVRAFQRLGQVKWWFWLHLSLGIAGPWLIVVHSDFHVGSLNAAVALFSMVAVVGSGVVGRFLSVRIHRGLDGERTSLEQLRTRAGLVESDARSKLRFAPTVEARLLAFEQRELQARPGWLTPLRQALVLPLQRWITYRRCVAELHARLDELAQRQAWTPQQRRERARKSRKLVDRYLDAVVRVAQWTAFARLFALWHVAHLPFVYLLVISAVVHVVAVHAY